MINIIIVGIGGAIGSIARYGVAKLFPAAIFPLSTLISNVVAGVLIGIYIGLDREFHWENEKLDVFVTTGLLGGLSTFSTFSLETVKLIETGNYAHAGWNVILNVFVCIASVIFSFFLIKMIFKK